MGLFSSGYKKKWDTQTQPINQPYSIGNTMSGCVYSSLLNSGSSLTDLFRNANADSMAGKLYNVAKNCAKGGKYADTIGSPEGTLIMKPLSKNSFQLASNLTVDKMLSVNLTKPSEELFTAYIYDLLVDTYEYENGIIYVETLDMYCAVHEINIDTNNQICIIYKYDKVVGGGPTQQVVEIQEEIETGIYWTTSLDSDYLLVKYQIEDKIGYWIWNTEEKNDILSSWLNSNKIFYYPSFYMRVNKNSIKREDPKYFEDAKEIFKRMNIDYEDLVDNFNGEAELNSETEEDKDYKDSLKNVTDICLTFALDVTVNDQRVMKYLYEFFKFMYQSSGLNSNKISYRHKAYNYDISWNNITFKTKEGRIAKFRRFTTEGIKKSIPYQHSIGQGSITLYKTVTCLRIRKQVDDNKYVEIEVTDLNFSSYNNGHKMSFDLPEFSNLEPYDREYINKLKNDEIEIDEDKNECLVPILPIIIKNRIGAMVGGDILAIAMRSVHNTYVKIKKKWYQSSWFMIIRIVIYVIVIVVNAMTNPGGLPAVIKGIISIEGLIQLLIVLAIKIAFKIICKIFHIEGSAKAIIETLIDMYCIYVLPGQVGSTSTATGEVVSVGSTAVTTTVTTTTALSTVASAMITSVANMVVNGNFTMEGVASMLGNIAVTGLMETSPLMATTLDLSTNPQFFYAVQTKNWSAMVMTVSSSIAKLMSAQLNKGDSKNLINQLTNNVENATDSLVKLAKNIDLTSIGSSIANEKSEKYQSRLKDLNQRMLRLGNLMEATNQAYSKVLSPNNSIVLGLITDSLLYDSNYDFFKTASIIKAPKSV